MSVALSTFAPEPKAQAVLPASWCLGAVLVLAFLAPAALSHVVVVDWTDSVERGVVGIVEALVVLWRATRSDIPVRSVSRGAAVLAGSVFGTLIVGAALAPNVAPAVVRVAEWMLHALFGWVMWTEAGRRHDDVARAWRGGSLLSAALVLGAALLLWLRLDSPEAYPWGSQTPFVQGPRWLGTCGLLAVLVSQAPSLRQTSRWIPWAWQVVGWAAVWWSGSRGALGAALAGATVLVLCSPRPARSAVSLLASSAAGALASIPLSMPALGMGLSRLWMSTVEGNGEHFSSGRDGLWRTTLEAWQQRPLWGLGPDGVLPHLAPIGSAHAHNTVVQAISEGGLLGGVPFLVALACLLFAALRRAWTTREPARVAAAAYATAALSNGLLDGLLYDPASTVMIVAAFSVALAPNSAPTRGEARHRRTALRSVAGACALVMALHLVVLRAVWTPTTPAPDAWQPALVRAFPSAPILGPVAAWGRNWMTEDPQAALELAHWGARQGRAPWLFLELEADLISESDHVSATALYRTAARSRAYARRHAPPWIQ